MRGRGEHVVPAHRVGERLVEFILADEDDQAQIGEIAADLAEHPRVVARLVPNLREQDGDPALLEHVGDFARAVRRIDVDQDRADLRRRELRDHPFDVVRRPDPDAVAVLDAER